MKIKHPANDDVITVHESAAARYLARGWVEVAEETPTSPATKAAAKKAAAKKAAAKKAAAKKAAAKNRAAADPDTGPAPDTAA